VALINQLHRAMRRRPGTAVLASTLKELVQCTRKHFETEENLMEKNGYADLAAHRQLHAKLVDQVLDFQKRFDSGVVTVSMDLMTFLRDWLLDHIDKVDRSYLPVLQVGDRPQTGPTDADRLN
jgi:hemerythrin-like metal-binding protein